MNPADFVLKNDQVTLMGVSESQAWFSVCSKSVYDLNSGFPFAFMTQFFKSEKLLIVDHETLHEIAAEIGQLPGNCVLINNTGRCGSTLLCQVMTFTNI